MYLFSWWQKGFQQEEGQQTLCRSTFQSSTSIMFDKTPLVQASHMAKSRAKAWTNKLYFLIEKAIKYCGHFFPSTTQSSCPDGNGSWRTAWLEQRTHKWIFLEHIQSVPINSTPVFHFGEDPPYARSSHISAFQSTIVDN